MAMDLRARWLDLCRALGARGDAAPFYDDLAARYGAEARAYHGLAHLDQCFTELDGVRAHVEDAAAIGLAIFFHDAVYDVRSGDDNEARSADLCDDACRALGIADGVRARVRRYILATKRHEGLDGDADGAIFLDIDMSILGQDRVEYERYERAVRREYAAVPDEAFNAGRAQFLRSVLAREAIFASAPFRERYEARARENMTRSLALLEAPRG
jgi:predicted metal-dependent HD superfamily phosphohydrolase